MTDKDINVALDFIDSCCNKNIITDDEWEKLKLYSCCSSYDVKYSLCDQLAFVHCNQSEEILLTMLVDDDFLIRTSACDALSFSKTAKTRDVLIGLLKYDRNKMVRGYAALSIGDIQKTIDVDSDKVISILKTQLKKERSKWTKNAIARSLVLLGESVYISNIFDEINNRYYTIRSFALNLIIELIESYEVAVQPKVLLTILYKRSETESARCVKDSIQKLISLINQQSGESIRG